MPVDAVEFWSVAICYVLAVLAPIVIIRLMLSGLGPAKNKYQIISAIVMYPTLFGSWWIAANLLGRLSDATVLGLFISLALGCMVSVMVLWLMKRIWFS